MRKRLAIWVFCLVGTSSGCSLVTEGVHITSYRAYASFEDFRERHRDRKWAEEAWGTFVHESPASSYSEDFERGFKDGFVEHLYRGTTEPPPAAPARYWKLSYQSPAGYQATQDWFFGFRRGVHVAQASGKRDLVTGPSSLRSMLPGPAGWPADGVAPPFPAQAGPAAGDGAPVPKHPVASPREQMPPPQPAAPAPPEEPVPPRPTAPPEETPAGPPAAPPAAPSGDK